MLVDAHAVRRPVLAVSALLTTLLALTLSAPGTVRAATENGWHLYVGEAVVDTLNASMDEVYAAGQWVLATNHWTVNRADPRTGKLVTEWKPVKHPLVRLATGPANVRVAVALVPAGPGRVEVRVLGGIATLANLEGGPILPLAQAAGQRECRGYVTEVKARLLDMRLADGAPSGAPKSTPAAAKR
ncbi:MAG: hypothetical protein ABI960_09300 [Candidatus Eisenbacteria bacterium]